MPETLPFRDMEGEDLAITVLTCEGDIKDPTFPFKLQKLVSKLQNLISDEENPIKVTKVEPWNSVRVTFNIPLEAAQRLRQLAERGDRVLRELGILSVQIEGDQVITLTLSSQYSEPQEIVLRKTSDEQGDVASVSFNIPNAEAVPGPSMAEPAHKNISQFLGHIVGGTASTSSAVSSLTRLEKTSPKPESSISFRSPNVIAPSSTEPIPFPPSALVTTTSATMPSSSRISPNVSVKPPTSFGPFPFASMTHAMNTKNNSASPQYQPVLHVQAGNPRLSFSSTAVQISNSILNSTCSAITATSSVSSKVSNSNLQKVPRTITNSAFNNVVTRAPPPNAIASTSRANVALSSPLLVNLLQSETSNLPQNNKLMPPPADAANQQPKRKRKPRKSKEKILEDGNAGYSASPSPPSYQSHIGSRSPGGFDPLSVLNQSLNVPINNNLSISSSQVANIHPLAQGQPPVSNIKPQTHQQGISLQPQIQGQPMVSTTRSLGPQNISAFRQTQGPRTVPNIHPQAQGQPQVHTGNLPLHTHIPVGAPQIARPASGSLQSYAMSAPRSMPLSQMRPLFPSRETSLSKALEKPNKDVTFMKTDRTSAPSTPSTSTPDSNPFPSPPSSSDGKTKHLINPFTGQLEPMPSDEEEEEESIGSLPPFPDFENDVSEKSHSERSLSDGGKDTNLSSDTDSGISKSITDVSQSSSEGLATDSGKDSKKSETSKIDISTASVASSISGEKIKLRLKLDPKTLRESKESEVKEKRKESNPQYNPKIDVAVVSIPGFKKNSPSAVTEPRVPPLHISLRGPNAAVVVSPRKDDSKSRYSLIKEDQSSGDMPSKVSQKKIRSPRTARTGDVSAGPPSATGRTTDLLDKRIRNSNKDVKKVKEEVWNQNVKNMSMSGGGIVEMSEKVSSSRISSYETYLSSTAVNKSAAQNKTSNIFSLASRDSCKSEVMTLTSCSTGESVTIHSFSGSKSPLPVQVPAVSETEVASVDASQAIQTNASSMASDVASSVVCGTSTVESTASTVQRTASAVERTASAVERTASAVERTASAVERTASTVERTVSTVEKNSPTIEKATPTVESTSSTVENTTPTVESTTPTVEMTTSTNERTTLAVESTSSTTVERVKSMVVDKLTNSLGTKSSGITSNVGCIKEDLFSNSRKSPIMQHLPHSPTALVDNKTSLQTNCSSAQTQSLSASSINVVSTVPLSTNSTSSSSCITMEETLDKTVPLQEDGLSKLDRVEANPVANVTSSVDGQTLQTNHQCNINPINNVKENIDGVLNVDNVQSEQFVSHTKSMQNIENPAICEVQNIVDVNKNTTAVSKESPDVDCSETVKIQSLISSQISSCNSSDKCKKLLFSNHSDSCNSLVACLTSVPKTEMNDTLESSDKSICLVGIKKSPIAQIINVDNLSIQPHVIEVPLQIAPAVPNMLAKTASEMKSVTSIISTGGSAFLQTRNMLVMQETNNTVSEGRTSPETNIVNAIVSEKPALSLPCIPNERIKLVNHVSAVPESVKESPPQNSSTAASEESSMDSIDEERKKNMQLPTSSPSSKLDTSLSKTDNIQNNNCSTSVTENLTSKIDVAQPSRVASSNIISTEGHSLAENILKLYSASIQQNNPVTSSVQATETLIPYTSSSNSNKDSSVEKVNCNSIEENCVSASGTLPSKESLPGVNISVITSEPSPSILLHDSGTSFAVENKPIIAKLDVKKETCSESVQVVSTSNSPIVTSLLSPVKYLPQEVSSQKFKLIFKGGQRAALQGNNSSSLVVPLNSSKTVPIKLVTLPGGASALSVRSTSNPNIVEIIGPKTSVSQNSQSIGNPHPSSPVRLVVSKVSPGLSCSSQSGAPNMRNRVVVKSVVMAGASPSLKLVSSSAVSTTTSVLTSSPAITTSSVTPIVSSPSTSVSCHLSRNLPDEFKLGTNIENSIQLISSYSMLSQASSEPCSVLSSKHSSPSTKSGIKQSSTFTTTCSSIVDSTTKDSLSSNSQNTVLVSKSLQRHTDVVDSTTLNKKEIPDTTSSVPAEEKISPPSDSSTKVPSPINSVSEPSETKSNPGKQCDNENSKKSAVAADTTSDAIANSTVIESTTVHPNKVDSPSTLDKNTKSEESLCTVESDPSLITSAVSEACVKSEQMSDSAITTSLTNISNTVVELSDPAEGNSATDPPVCSGDSKNQSSSELDESTQNSLQKNVCCLDIENSCIIENEVTIASTVENDLFITECVESNQKQELDSCIVQSSDDKSVQNDLRKSDEIFVHDRNSPIVNCGFEMQKIRPLGNESVIVVDSTDTDSTSVITEDSELEISLVYSKPLKRKCSENAAELIKACMGVEDAPKKAVLKPKTSEEVVDKLEIEETVRMSLRVRKEDTPLIKKAKGAVNSDCSTDEDITLSELVTKKREQPTRGRANNRDSPIPIEPNNRRPTRRRSGSNESRHSEDMKTRTTPRESKRESVKKEEPTPKKLPERTKRGTFKVQDQVLSSKVGVQRSGRIRDQESKANLLNNNKEESNFISAKRKTRGTADSQELLVQVKRRRFSKDGHR